MNILIIDDDEKYLSVISKALSRNFENLVKIYTQTKSNQGIKIAQQEDIDLILLDFHMPDTDGVTVAKILQHSSKTKNIPIIFVTSSSYSEFKDAGFGLGSVDYISKPLDLNLLINRISLYLTIINQNKLLVYVNEQLKNDLDLQVAKTSFQEKMIIHQSKSTVLGEMIGAIAHQWRQPLNIIASSMMNLETKADFKALDTQEIHRVAKKVNNTVQELSSTIDNFRNMFLFSQYKEEVDLIKVLDSSIEFVKKQFNSHDILIDFSYDIDSDFNMNCYYNELRQVILNLLTNSKDAISKNRQKLKQESYGGRINVSLVKKKDKVTIKVCDNGGGIAEDILPKIFNPYFTTKFEEQGTGVGLYLCKMIIEKFHDGSIEVDNIDSGCCFTIEFTL